MCVYKNYLIIFGGIHEVTKELDDLHAFNINGNRYILLSDLDNGKHVNDFLTVSPVVSPMRKPGGVMSPVR